MSFDLENLSIDELEAVIAEAKQMLAQHQARKTHKAYLEVLQIASRERMSIEELITTGRRIDGREKPAKQVKKVEPQYRNPENHTETWTGRGRTPLWLASLLANGANRNDFLITR